MMIKEIRTKKNWKSFILNIVSPAFITIVLFNVSIFSVIIPAMKKNMIERKKETIKELTLAVISELKDLHLRELAGEISRIAAQEQAKKQINNIRYGSEGKDYFWVSDVRPYIITHPYRSDLDGKDVSHYSDPSGKKLFVEFARIVRQSDEGYVDYLWQWKDNPDKIVPKLSYVKIFRPWGWIVGTGIYLEDVREEISLIGQRVIIISSIISFIIFVLLFYISGHGFRLEVKRQRAERALRESEEKYRLLVESSNEGVALTIDDMIAYSNKTLQQMLDFTAAELSKLSIHEIIAAQGEGEQTNHSLSVAESIRLKSKEGKILDVVCTNSAVTFGGRNAVIYTFRGINKERKADETLKQLLSELQTSLLMPNTQIKDAQTKLVECEIDCSIKNAIELMSNTDSRAILVKSPSGHHLGIVTDLDLRERVLLKGLDINAPISLVMSSPLIKISNQALFFEATNLFMEKDVHHIAVTDENDKITGIFSTKEVLQTQRHPAAILIKEIQNATSIQQIKDTRQALPSLVKALLDSGAKIESVTRIVSTISDTIIIKLIDLAIQQFGPVPVKFSFVSFGSVAREEQTLKTDQDNGIIYDDPAPGEESKVHQYFLKLGEFVCQNLDYVGYSYCKGDVMAKNPKWCQSISSWKKYFSDCVYASNPQDLLDINVFFDLRSVYGAKEYVATLKELFGSIVKDRHTFFYHLAQNTLQYRPPLSFFGNIQLEHKDNMGEAFNIKAAIIPIVNFARIYALKNSIDEANTLSRLKKLLDSNLLLKSSYDELVQAFAFLMQMRMVHQANQISEGESPDNFIEIPELTQIEQSLLKKILSDIIVFQAKVARDFIRGE